MEKAVSYKSQRVGWKSERSEVLIRYNPLVPIQERDKYTIDRSSIRGSKGRMGKGSFSLGSYLSESIWLECTCAN